MSNLPGTLTRRDFFRLGSAGAVGLSLPDLGRPATAGRGSAQSCILLFLVGGPSHLDTWDLKPDAPVEIRGPFRPIRTRVPGVQVGEHFPLLAGQAERIAIVRSVHHTESPIHETGQQLLQTGRLCPLGHEYPHYGAVLSHLRSTRSGGLPPFVILPGPIGNTGVSISHGQGAGCLGERHAPAFGANLRLPHERDNQRERYGRTTFGQNCLLARRLIEHGVRLVTVNMFDTVFDKVTWDCHAADGSLPATLNDYRDVLCPTFDRAYTALLEDLDQRGLLETTLVVAMGEFGRTPRLNANGGRDHWPGVWSILFAGGGVRGGQVIGASDRTGTEPADRPVTPAEVAASIYRALGIDSATSIPGPAGRPVRLVEARPVEELFCG
jgi:uncharacterized protein (DUF1501 family)